ncbi:hypothetical protein Hanom_Chr07g00648171 [Helianthus anomalus]
MHPFNCGFIPPRSSADTNQTSNPSCPVSPVPTRPTPYGSGFVDFNQHQTGFMNLLNQPISWDPNLYGWNPNQNMDGMGPSQVFGSAQAFGLATMRARGRSGYTTGNIGDGKRKNKTPTYKENRNPSEKKKRATVG